MAKLDRQTAFSSILGAAKQSQGKNNQELLLADIHLNPDQPRKFFSEEALESLTESVKEKGVLQPVLVREHHSGYELVAGERRFRAAQRAGLETIPAVIRDVSDLESLEIALIENLQREDLNPVEETDGTLTLLSIKLGIPVQDVLEAIRQSHYRALGRTDNNVVINPHVTATEALFKQIGRYTASSFYSHRVPILKLPSALVEAVREGKLEYSKARVLAGVEDEEVRAELLELTLSDGLSLKQLKEAVSSRAAQNASGSQPHAEHIDLTDFKRRLTSSRIEKLSASKQRQLNKLLAKVDALLED